MKGAFHDFDVALIGRNLKSECGLEIRQALPTKLLRWKIIQTVSGEFFLYEIDQTLSDKCCLQKILQPAAAESKNLITC